MLAESAACARPHVLHTGCPMELCLLQAALLPVGKAHAFTWEGDARAGGGFVLHHASGFVAFRNACPHWGVDLDMGLGGGALMTRASYPVALAYMILGKPQEVVAAARFHHTGADKQVSAILKYENGIANIMGGFVSNSDMVGRIYGTAGSILLDPWWYETESFTIVENGGESRAVKMPKHGKGFTHEIDECVRCIRAGKIQSDLWSHRHSLEWKGIIDEIRMQIGLKYPFE